MRFFSNDAREAPDDQTPDDRTPDDRTPDGRTPHDRTPHDRAPEDHPDRVQSEPVAVPGQRPPSPWATPADTGAPAAPAAVPADSYEPTVDDDPDRTQAYPAGSYATVPDSVESPSDTNTTTYPGSTVTAPGVDPDDIVDVPLDDADATTGGRDRDRGATDERDRSDMPEKALQDEGGFDDPRAVDPATAQPLETPGGQAQDRQQDRQRANEPAAAIKDEGGFEDPQVVETATEVTPVPAPASPTAHQATQSDTLFATADAQGLKERWRDVQLRFVDSPKEATEEAAKLVEEAVDKLTASLRSRGETGADSDDTEALRVRLRAYRDTLDRIVNL